MSPHYSADAVERYREQQIFLDGTIHGLRAPLRGIGTSATLLAQRLKDRLDAESHELIRAILEGVNVLNNFTKALAEYSVALFPKISGADPLPVENAVQSAVASLQPEIRETGAIIHWGRLPKITADHEQLAVLFRHLIRNGLDHCSADTRPHIEISATPAASEWRFAINDNGPGIPPQYQRQVFEPFERLHSKPSPGLGLAVSRNISVSGHGGRLWVDSKEGDGTTFFFTLPNLAVES